MAYYENTITAENNKATCCNSLPFSHFGLYYCFWAQLVSTVCVAVLMQCSHVCSIVTSLPIVTIMFQFCSSQFLLLSHPLPSPHSPTSLSLTSPPIPSLPQLSPHFPLPSPPPLPFRPFFPEHVPDPEVSCSVGCPNLHCWEQVAEEDCSG